MRDKLKEILKNVSPNTIFLLLPKRQIYTKHLIKENHCLNLQFEILQIENKGLQLTLLESLGINNVKHCNSLLNDQLDTNSSPLLNMFTYPVSL